jgi:hypothetical protein
MQRLNRDVDAGSETPGPHGPGTEHRAIAASRAGLGRAAGGVRDTGRWAS